MHSILYRKIIKNYSTISVIKLLCIILQHFTTDALNKSVTCINTDSVKNCDKNSKHLYKIQNLQGVTTQFQFLS